MTTLPLERRVLGRSGDTFVNKVRKAQPKFYPTKRWVYHGMGIRFSGSRGHTSAFVSPIWFVSRPLNDWRKLLTYVKLPPTHLRKVVHETIAREESQEVKEGIIIQEVRSGFLLHGKLLRPTIVKVFVGPGHKKVAATTKELDEQPTTAVE